MSAQRISLSRMLRPRSIAVIGASNKKGKQGNTIIEYLNRYGYKGKVYPVNPQEESIGGHPCFKSVLDIPGEVDLAIFCLPNTHVPAVAEQCVQKGIGYAVVWAAGFGELKSEEGRRLDAQLREICGKGNLKVCGPNSLGIINTADGMVASFTTALNQTPELKKGRIAFVSQSGGTVAAIIDDLLANDMGFGVFVSTGNELNLTFADYALEILEYDNIDIIVGYVEGIRDGGKFMEAAHRARELNKQIILVKGGRSAAAADAVRSHTGAIAGSDGIYRTAFREAGVIQVQSTEELMDMVFYLNNPQEDPGRFGRRTVVMCTGGGSGIQALDAVERSELEVATLSDETLDTIRQNVPGFAGVSSHLIDVTPQMLMDPNYLGKFDKVLGALDNDPNIDVILFVQASSAPSAKGVCEALVRHRESARKPVILTWWALPEAARNMLKDAGIYIFPSQARAIGAIASFAKYCEQRKNIRERVRPQSARPDIAWPKLELGKGPAVLTEDIVSPWLEKYGIGNASARLVPDEKKAAEAAAELTYPVVVKVISEGLAHRSKYGLVALDIRDEAALREKCALMRKNAKERLGLDRIGGFWVQQFRPRGLELILGGFCSEPFGHVMVCGIGGYLAEFFQPVYRLLPIDEEEAEKMLSELVFLKKYPEEVDLDALKRSLIGFSNLLLDCPWEQFELELNPVKVLPKGQGALAVDALGVVRK